MLHTAGEELLMDHFAGERSQPPETWYIGLYNRSDDLEDADTTGAITTDPDYDGPKTVRWPDDFGVDTLEETSGAGIRLTDIQPTIEFDISTATEVVDAYYVAAEFQSTVLGQTSEYRNLVWSQRLDDEYDLGADANDTFPLTGVQFGVT
jgi:hypothetical protein